MTDAVVGRNRDSPLRVAIVEDHLLLSAALSTALRAEGHHVVVPALTSAPEVTRDLFCGNLDVPLLDQNLGALGDGDELLAPVMAAGVRVVVVSGATDEAVIGRCLEQGAFGWVPKTASFDQLFDAVVDAANGRPVLNPAERDRLLRAWRDRRTTESAAFAPFSRLSPRDASVLTMLACAGRSTA